MRPRHRPRRSIIACVVLLLAAAAFSGCGDDAAGRPATLRVALDFIPNAVHAPIFTAVREGDDKRHGLRIDILRPGSQPDSLKALFSGRADVGLLDIHDLGIAREHGRDIVAIGALVQKPLAALIAQPGIHRPRDLGGRTVGVSGLPSDPAFLKAIVQNDGGDYQSIRQVTIGFAAVSALVGRKVDAVPAFWNAEGVALRERGRPMREFRVEDYGAPPYPEVVLMTTRKLLARRRGDVQRFLAAVRDGMRSVLAKPEPAVRQIAKEAGAEDLGLVRAQLAAVRPLFDPSLALHRPILERWASFDARIGILDRRIDVGRAFAFDLG
jgi:NitT/TauT family transport system substrate-binding protein/putative hydroxymethylpyrimidine transport system substrate-binding protein